MTDRSAALGLLLLAALAWSLPPLLRWTTRAMRPESPVVYRDAASRQLSWSPASTFDATPEKAVPRGWEGLLLGVPLDLNQATSVDLEALPGIGPKTAAAILEARGAAGGFRDPEDLLRVPGIGPKRLEALRPLVRAGLPQPE